MFLARQRKRYRRRKASIPGCGTSWTGSIKRRTPLFCWAKNTAYRKKMKKKGKRNMNKKDDFELFAYSITESYNNCKKFLKEEFGKEGRKKLQKKAKGQKAGADA